MSIESGQSSRPVDLGDKAPGEPDTPAIEALASLEAQLQAESDARKEERFLWIVVCTLLVDVIWFRGSSNAALPLLALVLELVILFILARRMQIDEISVLINGLVNSVGSKVGGGGSET